MTPPSPPLPPAGEIAGAATAANDFRKSIAAEEADRRREHDRLLDAHMRQEAAQGMGLAGPG